MENTQITLGLWCLQIQEGDHADPRSLPYSTADLKVVSWLFIAYHNHINMKTRMHIYVYTDFVFSAGVRTQGVGHIRQVLYHGAIAAVLRPLFLVLGILT